MGDTNEHHYCSQLPWLGEITKVVVIPLREIETALVERRCIGPVVWGHLQH